jgi:hypothetical protein
VSGVTIPLPSVERRWAIAIARQATPLAPAVPERPSLSRTATGADAAFFVADPFLARDGDGWVVFFELLGDDGRGRIAFARSADGVSWHYGGIALEEPGHLSYPCVFDADGTMYMTPESLAAGRIAVYRAVDFPRRWTFASIAVTHPSLVDPTVFRHGGRWWMLASTSDGAALLAFHAAHPEAAWTPHAHNPVVTGAARARPGGRPFAFEGRLWRPAQDVSRGYGRRVSAIEILELTPDVYREAAAATPLGGPTGRGWNAHGMHHFDAQPDPGGGWLVATDGYRRDLMFGYRRLGARP